MKRVLGQRRTLIGKMRFVADQRDLPGIAEIAQRQRRAPAAFAGADNDHSRSHRGHPISIITVPASTLTGSVPRSTQTGAARAAPDLWLKRPLCLGNAMISCIIGPSARWTF